MNCLPTFLLPVLLFAALMPAAVPQRGKPLPAQSDTAIEQNIRARFAKSKIAEDKFTVRVQGGVAVIEGNTRVIQRKGVATRLAKAGGARSVDNRIRIAEEARAKAAERLRATRPRSTGRTSTPAAKTPIAAATKTAAPAPTKADLPATTPAQPAAIPHAVVKH